MLSPDNPYAPLVLGLALLALVAALGARAALKDRREYRRFKRYRSTVMRQRMFRKWLIDSVVTFGGSAVLVLVLVWQFVPLLLDEVAGFWWVQYLRTVFAGPGALVILAGITAVVIAISVVAVVAARNTGAVPAVGDIQALLPRNRVELRYGAALSINAGVVEELLFRLAVPTLIFGLTGDAVVAFLGALVLFGALHVYQGAAGIIGSMVIGGVLTALYLATGSILAAIVLHMLIDLRTLVLIPVLVFRVHRQSATPTSPPSRDLPLP